MSGPLATIDSQALRHNLGVVRGLAPRSRVLAVIKADAYGHGIVTTAHALDDADALGVARLNEALALRAAQIARPIVLLEGAADAEQMARAAQHELEMVVHCAEQVQMLEQVVATRRFDVWLKIDTGMNRLGFRREDFEVAFSRLQKSPAVRSIKLMTHLASADVPGSTSADEQIRSFFGLTSGLSLERSIANSAGIIRHPEARLEWVRPGLMLYGISPLGEQSTRELDLQPVMTLSTSLIAVRVVKRGEAVGYGALWHAERDSKIGIAAIGYGDGYPRTMRNGTPVLVDGKQANTVGRVSMDMIAIDITHLPDAHLGSEVVLWGRGLPAERVAPFADTLAYELLCRVNERVTVKRVDS